MGPAVGRVVDSTISVSVSSCCITTIPPKLTGLKQSAFVVHYPEQLDGSVIQPRLSQFQLASFIHLLAAGRSAEGCLI